MTEPRKRKPAKAPKPPKAPAKGAAGKGALPADGRKSAFTPAQIKAIRGTRTLKAAGEMVGITWRAWLAWERGERAPSRSLEILLALMRDGKVPEPPAPPLFG